MVEPLESAFREHWGRVLAALITDPGYRPEGEVRYRLNINNFFNRLRATPGSALGVDIGGIEAIHARLLACRAAGKAVLVVSVELDEILALADRILVMSGGRFVGELTAAEATEQRLGLLMAGIEVAA